MPGHTKLVPSTARTGMPLISNGQISDIEVIGSRVFIVGTFTSLKNTTGNMATVNQAYLAAYNLDTGLIDTTFRPTFSGGTPVEVEASPDGTKLFVGGSFNSRQRRRAAEGRQPEPDHRDARRPASTSAVPPTTR